MLFELRKVWIFLTHQTLSKLLFLEYNVGSKRVYILFHTCVWISPGKKSWKLSNVKLTLALAESKQTKVSNCLSNGPPQEGCVWII